MVRARRRLAAAARRLPGRRDAADASFRQAFDHAPIGMALVAPDGRFLRVNEAARTLWGRTEEVLLAGGFQAITHPEDLDEDLALVQAVLDGRLDEYTIDKRYLRPGGEVVWAQLSVTLVRDEDGAPVHFIAQLQDVTERRAIDARLAEMVSVDELTGLWNRRRFGEELERTVERCRRYGERAALLLLDLDNFKVVNDTFGHKAGDDLLRAVGEVLRERLRTTDSLARLGGDEFAVLLSNVAPDEAAAVAQELGAALRDRGLDVGEGVVRPTASIGVAFLDEGTVSDRDALVRADVAMYEAKRHGRDRASADDQAVDPAERLRTSQRVRVALEEQRFVLHAQPVFDLRTRRPVLYELLVRMRDDDGSLLPPAAFLPVAERAGQIETIDRWVLAEACREQAAWAGRGRDLRLAVNLSGRSVGDPGLAAHVEQSLRETGADPSRLTFEITETAAIANMEQAQALLERLRALGCRTALDDFGSGFASFQYLKHLPLDVIKIDGDFVRDVRSDRHSPLVVRAIVGIARALGVETVAEWVATPAIEAAVRDLGVDQAQGFALGIPEPLAALMAHGPTARVEAAPAAPAAKAVRVLHCDDSEPFRALVKAMLTGRPDIEHVGEAPGHGAALEAAARLRPDVILLDAHVDDLRGEIIAELQAVAPEARVVVLSGSADEDLPLAGVVTRVRKSATADELAAAVLGSAVLA